MFSVHFDSLWVQKLISDVFSLLTFKAHFVCTLPSLEVASSRKVVNALQCEKAIWLYVSQSLSSIFPLAFDLRVFNIQDAFFRFRNALDSYSFIESNQVVFWRRNVCFTRFSLVGCMYCRANVAAATFSRSSRLIMGTSGATAVGSPWTRVRKCSGVESVITICVRSAMCQRYVCSGIWVVVAIIAGRTQLVRTSSRTSRHSTLLLVVIVVVVVVLRKLHDVHIQRWNHIYNDMLRATARLYLLCLDKTLMEYLVLTKSVNAFGRYSHIEIPSSCAFRNVNKNPLEAAKCHRWVGACGEGSGGGGSSSRAFNSCRAEDQRVPSGEVRAIVHMCVHVCCTCSDSSSFPEVKLLSVANGGTREMNRVTAGTWSEGVAREPPPLEFSQGKTM